MKLGDFIKVLERWRDNDVGGNGKDLLVISVDRGERKEREVTSVVCGIEKIYIRTGV